MSELPPSLSVYITSTHPSSVMDWKMATTDHRIESKWSMEFMKEKLQQCIQLHQKQFVYFYQEIQNQQEMSLSKTT